MKKKSLYLFQPLKLDKFEKREYRRDIILTSFIGAYYFIQALNLLIKLVDLPIPLWNIVSKIILSIILLLCIPTIIRRARTVSFFSILIVFFVYLFSLLNQDFENSETIGYFFNSIFVFLPLGICIFSINDYQLFFKTIRYWSLTTHAALFILIIMLLNANEAQTYSISIGYALLMQFLIVLDLLFQKKHLFYLVLTIIDFILIILVGSRGPIVCILVFLLLWSTTIIKDKKHRALVFFGFIIIVPILYLSYPALLNSLLKLSDMMGTGGRTIKKLISGSIADDSGRKEIQALCLENIRNKPVFGWGVSGGWPNSIYPHSIILEYLLSFGFPFGILFMILTFWRIFKGCTTKNVDKQRISFILTANCVMLLFSGTFLSTPTFYMVIMNSFSLNKNNTQKKTQT